MSSTDGEIVIGGKSIYRRAIDIFDNSLPTEFFRKSLISLILYFSYCYLLNAAIYIIIRCSARDNTKRKN